VHNQNFTEVSGRRGRGEKKKPPAVCFPPRLNFGVHRLQKKLGKMGEEPGEGKRKGNPRHWLNPLFRQRRREPATIYGEKRATTALLHLSPQQRKGCRKEAEEGGKEVER